MVTGGPGVGKTTLLREIARMQALVLVVVLLVVVVVQE